MARWIKKRIEVEATEWNKQGDHPKDDIWRRFEDTGKQPDVPREGLVVRYYRRPDVDGHEVCSHCKLAMHSHGWIDTRQGGHTVCPGDFIITELDGKGYYPCKPDVFFKTYDSLDMLKSKVTPESVEALYPDREQRSRMARACVGLDAAAEHITRAKDTILGK